MIHDNGQPVTFRLSNRTVQNNNAGGGLIGLGVTFLLIGVILFFMIQNAKSGLNMFESEMNFVLAVSDAPNYFMWFFLLSGVGFLIGGLIRKNGSTTIKANPNCRLEVGTTGISGVYVYSIARDQLAEFSVPYDQIRSVNVSGTKNEHIEINIVGGRISFYPMNSALMAKDLILHRKNVYLGFPQDAAAQSNRFAPVQAAPAMSYCPYCGAQVKPGAVFCAKCGKKQ